MYQKLLNSENMNETINIKSKWGDDSSDSEDEVSVYFGTCFSILTNVS